EAGHTLVEVKVEPGLNAGAFAVGPTAHQEAALPRHGVPAARLVRGAERADVRREVVTPEGGEGAPDVGLREDRPEADLPGPALAEDLIDLAAIVGADAARVRRIRDVYVVLSVEELHVDVLRAAVGDGPAARGKALLAEFARHRLADAQGSDVEGAEPR